VETSADRATQHELQSHSSSSKVCGPTFHQVAERQTPRCLGSSGAERQLPFRHIADETDNKSAFRFDTRQYAAASPGAGKSHLAAAIGLALVENGRRVLFTRTSELVQRLQIARRELGLESAIAKLDKYHLVILDDIAYVSKDQAETSVLFELIGSRYERLSLLITANQPFGEWGNVFPDQAMTLAAIDRLVHHATIMEMNVESYRRRAAIDRKRGPGRPPAHATIKEST
jgi:hypothetical protein